MIIVKVPNAMGALGKNSETRQAPDAIVKKINPPKSVVIENAEIVPFDLEKTNENISNMARTVFWLSSEKALFLGGDHSITYPVFKEFSKRFSKPALIVLDAHIDCYRNFNPPSNAFVIRTLIEERILKPDDVFFVGARIVSEKDLAFAKSKRIKYFTTKKTKEHLQELKRRLRAFVLEHDAVYLSIDFDVFDPEVVPGSGYKVPNGLQKKQVLDLVKLIEKTGKLRCTDIVEINPSFDVGEKTVALAAELIRLLE